MSIAKKFLKLKIPQVFGQAIQSYSYRGDCMLEYEKKINLSPDEKMRFNSIIKIGIYKELGAKSFLSDCQASLLIEKTILHDKTGQVNYEY